VNVRSRSTDYVMRLLAYLLLPSRLRGPFP